MRARTAGLTIIELMIALAVASIAFAALAYSQITGFRVTRSSQGVAIAKDIGMKKLEQLRGYGFDWYSGCPDHDPGEPFPDCEGEAADEDHPAFTVHWDITERPAGVKAFDDPSMPPALKGVEVWVTWDGGRYDLIGYLSCGDPGESATTEVPCPSESLRPGVGS